MLDHILQYEYTCLKFMQAQVVNSSWQYFTVDVFNAYNQTIC